MYFRDWFPKGGTKKDNLIQRPSEQMTFRTGNILSFELL